MPYIASVMAIFGGLYEALRVIGGDHIPALINAARSGPYEVFWGNPNWFAEVMALSGPCGIPFIVASGCRAMILAVIISLVLYLWRRNWALRPWFFLIVPAVVIFLARLKVDSTNARLELWHRTWMLIKDNPWGTENFSHLIDTYRLGSVSFFRYSPHPDSDLLWMLATFGWVGGGILILVLLFALWKLYRPRFKDCFFISAVGCMFLFSHPLGSPWFWLFGAIYVINRFRFDVPKSTIALILPIAIIHSTYFLTVHPFGSFPKSTRFFCKLGSSRACRYSRLGDWYTSLGHTKYDKYMILRYSESNGSCRGLFLVNSMLEGHPFDRILSSQCRLDETYTHDRERWLKLYNATFGPIYGR